MLKALSYFFHARTCIATCISFMLKALSMQRNKHLGNNKDVDMHYIACMHYSQKERKTSVTTRTCGSVV